MVNVAKTIEEFNARARASLNQQRLSQEYIRRKVEFLKQRQALEQDIYSNELRLIPDINLQIIFSDKDKSNQHQNLSTDD